jgi:branched-chain amino acid transport system substrate-binding protein
MGSLAAATKGEGTMLRTAKWQIAALLVLTLVTAACAETDEQGDSAGDTGAGGDTSGGTVKIGAVLPLTGPNATIGEDQQRGIDLAVEHINADGGVLGKDLEVLVEDSGGTPEAAIDAARKLVETEGVPVVMGEYSSGNTLPMAQFLQREGVVHINPGSSSPDLREVGDYSFGVIGLDDVAGAFTAEKAWELGYRSATFLGPNNPYGQGLVRATKARFEELGGTIEESILYTEGKTDYRNEVQRLAAGNPDVMIYTAYGTEAATINRQAFELGLSDQLPFFCVYLTLCAADSEPQTVEGQQGIEVNYIGPDGTDYQEAYQEKYGEDFASTFNGYLYDAVQLSALAIEEAGGTEPDAIRDALPEVDNKYEPVTGPIEFDDENQRTEQPYIFVEVIDGKVEEVD